MAFRLLAAAVMLPSLLAVRTGRVNEETGSCKKATYSVGLPDGQKIAHKLDPLDDGNTVSRECGGGFDGTVLFACNGGKWKIVQENTNCYKSGVCAANDELQLDLGDGADTLITFSVPETPVGVKPIEIPCSTGTSSNGQTYGGTLTLSCEAAEGEELPGWAVVDQACSFCAAADYKVTMPDGKVVIYNLNVLTEDKDVQQPCEAGFSGVVTFACQDFQWTLVREKTDCVKREVCPMTELNFHLDEKHDLVLDVDDNRKPGHTLVVPCGTLADSGAENVNVEGTVTLTCDEVGSEVLWSITTHNCKIVES